jgi:hypothetical protein
LYSFSGPGQRIEGPSGTRVEFTTSNPPLGFFSKSILPPFVSQVDATQVTGTEEQDYLVKTIHEYLSFGDELKDDELELFKARQRRVLSFLESLADKTTSRRG